VAVACTAVDLQWSGAGAIQAIISGGSSRNACRESRGVLIMNIIARGIVAFVLSLIIPASIAATSFAQTPTKSLKDQLVGHWQLVSVSINNTTPYGADPQGSMFLDASGHYSVIVITGGNARNISYFGTYTVNDADSSMTMHIDASSGANAVGRDEKRIITFNADELIVENQKSAVPLGAIKLTWKQAN
jgi:hypothetical protein